MAFDIERIEKSVMRVRTFVKNDSKRPTTKDIHDLRTGARRLESTLNALTLNSGRRHKRLLRDLADARKGAGKVRDMDVLTAHALSLDHGGGEQDCLVRLIEYLGAERDKAARKLRATLRKSGPQLRRELRRGFRDIEKVTAKGGEDGSDSNTTSEVAEKALQLSSQLSAPPQLNKKNLHAYRLKVKEARYVLQLSDNANDRQFVEKLGEAQDAIGEWHDLVELIGIAEDALDHGKSCKVLRQLRSLANSKFEKALFLSGQLRSNYLRLKSSKRKGAGAGRQTSLSKPVLVDASAIARS